MIPQTEASARADVDFGDLKNLLFWPHLLERVSALPPLYWSPVNSSWVATGHEAVKSALQSSSFGRRAPFPGRPASPSPDQWPVFAMPLEHRVIRESFLKSLPALQGLHDLDANVSQADVLVAKIVESTNVDVRRQLAEPFVEHLLKRVLAIPDEDFCELRKQCVRLDAAFNGVRPTRDALRTAESGFNALVNYFRQHGPQTWPDIAYSPLASARVASALALFLDEAHDVLPRFISNAFDCIAIVGEVPDKAWSHSSVQEWISSLLREVARFASPTLIVPRFAVKNTTLIGADIQAEETVLCVVGVANRDRTVFDDPNAFLVGRSNADQHLGFGSGPHKCPFDTLTYTCAAGLIAAVLPYWRPIAFLERPRRWTTSINSYGPEDVRLSLGGGEDF